MRTRHTEVEPVEAPSAPASESGTGLRFNESLSWRAGNKLSTGELLRRLQTLAKELKDLDQEEVDRSALATPAKELATSNLLNHKDGGVRAWTACCLADIFRLCAPDAPFTAAVLKDIFTLIVTNVIPSLSDPQNPYNGQHLYVLHSLSQVKSIVLILDLPASSQLVLRLFESCFDILAGSGDDLSKNVEYNMTGMLEAIVEESHELPNEVVDIILAQFLRADLIAAQSAVTKTKKAGVAATVDANQSTLRPKQLSAAYNMAKNICNTCVDRMTRSVSLYFSNVIMSSSSHEKKHKPRARRARASSDNETSDDDEERGPDEEDIRELQKAHKLLRELWKSSPGVLQNVIPQIETELGAENEQLRLLATEAIGDMASGIGAAGPPPPPVLDPAAYPPSNLEAPFHQRSLQGGPLAPSASHSFSQSHMTAYQSFLSRRNDKSPLIRSAWTTAIGRILSTSAGGTGLSPPDEKELTKLLSGMLIDNDEKVRIVAVQACALFSFQDFISKLGFLGGVDEPDSVLHHLADRVKDRKHAVGTVATLFLGRLWGVAYGEIAAGNERVRKLLGLVPSKILDAVYVNDSSINLLVDKVIFESLLPIGFPLLKRKEAEARDAPENTGSQLGLQSKITESDADKIRTERLLFLVRDLEPRAKVAFLARMSRPRKLSEYMKAFLKACEDYNGGVSEKGGKDSKEAKAHLGKLIDFLAKLFPDAQRVTEDLWKFAKAHDRRAYSLIRFCMAHDSDYRKIQKSMKELGKRLNGLSTTVGTLPETMNILLYRVSNLFYNKSHIHPIIQFSQTDEKSLGSVAHELLKEVSISSPGAFKAHAQELCQVLQEQAPGSGQVGEVGAVTNIKACAIFASRYPGDVPNDRKFLQAMVQYALCGTPATAAKHAISIIISVTDKTDMYAQDLVNQCIEGFSYGSEYFLTRLAALSQLMLMAYNNLDEVKDVDPIIDIAINQILLQNRVSKPAEESVWDDHVNEECEAKIWALKILVNRIRAHDDAVAVKEIATPTYQLLNNLIELKGEVSAKSSTPGTQRSRLRLQAALLHLKLCTKKNFDGFLSARAFNNLATVAQDPSLQVRERFITKVKKYLNQDRLPSRFYTIVFLMAFEPSRKLREDSATWIRARSTTLAKAKRNTFDTTLARLLSLLAHHPDFDTGEEELEVTMKYIMFYLTNTATEENLSLLYHVAQRVKSVQDGIDADLSDRLYYLSELAQAMIAQYEDLHGWSMQAYEGKLRLPSGIFSTLPNHDVAQEIANKQYLPQEFLDQVEGLVKASMRNSKKRKSDADDIRGTKKRNITAAPAAETPSNNNDNVDPPNTKTLPIRKAPKKSTTKTPKQKGRTSEVVDAEAPSSERRRSGRAAGRKSYAEAESEDDEQGEVGVEAGEKRNGKATVNDDKARQNGDSTGVKKTVVLAGDSSDDELSDPPDSEDGLE